MSGAVQFPLDAAGTWFDPEVSLHQNLTIEGEKPGPCTNGIRAFLLHVFRQIKVLFMAYMHRVVYTGNVQQNVA